MAFWSKGKDDKKEEEMEEIKRQVGGKKTKLPEPPKPSRDTDSEEEVSKMPTTQEPEPGETKESEPAIPTTTAPKTPPTDEDFAPLFVKIDKYKQVLQNLEEIKNTLNDLKELFTLMNHLDDVKGQGMDSLKQGISELADTLLSMDEKFIRPEGTEEVIQEPKSEVSKTVQELRKELKGVRDDLERL